MGAIIGVVVGYLLGVRAGEQGLEELREAWQTVSTSEEVKDMIAGGLALVGDTLRQARVLLADRLQVEEPNLRSVA